MDTISNICSKFSNFYSLLFQLKQFSIFNERFFRNTLYILSKLRKFYVKFIKILTRMLEIFLNNFGNKSYGSLLKFEVLKTYWGLPKKFLNIIYIFVKKKRGKFHVKFIIGEI